MARNPDARAPGAIIDDAYDRIEAAEEKLQDDYQNIAELRASVGSLLSLVGDLVERVRELELRLLPMRQLKEYREQVPDCERQVIALRAELDARRVFASSDESE